MGEEPRSRRPAPVTPLSPPPAARSPARTAGPHRREAPGRYPDCFALVFTQLEPYMDENFISRAFATMGETVMSVKIIRNRLTGYIFLLRSSRLSLYRRAAVILENVNMDNSGLPTPHNS